MFKNSKWQRTNKGVCFQKKKLHVSSEFWFRWLSFLSSFLNSAAAILFYHTHPRVSSVQAMPTTLLHWPCKSIYCISKQLLVTCANKMWVGLNFNFKCAPGSIVYLPSINCSSFLTKRGAFLGTRTSHKKPKWPMEHSISNRQYLVLKCSPSYYDIQGGYCKNIGRNICPYPALFMQIMSKLKQQMKLLIKS